MKVPGQSHDEAFGAKKNKHKTHNMHPTAHTDTQIMQDSDTCRNSGVGGQWNQMNCACQV